MFRSPSPAQSLAIWYFAYFAFIGVFNTYFNLYLKSLGISAWELAVLASLQPVLRMIAPAFWGWLADKYAAKVTVVAVVVLSLVASVLIFSSLFLSRGFWALFVVLGLLAFFWSASLPLVEALTLSHLQQRMERYGHIRLWGSVGFICSVFGIGVALDYLPINAVLWLCLVAMLATLLAALPLREGQTQVHDHLVVPLREQFRRPEVLSLFAASFMMAAAHAAYYIFYSIHLVDHGYSKTAVGALWAVGVLAEIGVFMFWPRLLQLFSLPQILLGSLLIAALRFLLIGWLIDQPLIALLAQPMHAATFGAWHAGSMAMLCRQFSPQQQGRAQALYSSVSFGAGGLLGGLIAGYVWEPYGAGATYTLSALFAAIGAVLLWWGGKKRVS